MEKGIRADLSRVACLRASNAVLGCDPGSGCRVQGLGSRVKDLGSGFRVEG